MKYLQFYFLDIIPFLLIAALIIVCIRYFKCKKTQSFSAKREVLILIFYLYLTALFLKTCVPSAYLRFDFSSMQYMLPDKTYIYNNPYQSYVYIRAYVIEHRWFELFNVFIINVLMFIPFGFMFPLLYKKLSSYTFFIGVLISVGIEIIQLFLPRLTDTFDIFLNTIGVIIGYLLYILYGKIKNRKN